MSKFFAVLSELGCSK